MRAWLSVTLLASLALCVCAASPAASTDAAAQPAAAAAEPAPVAVTAAAVEAASAGVVVGDVYDSVGRKLDKRTAVQLYGAQQAHRGNLPVNPDFTPVELVPGDLSRPGANEWKSADGTIYEKDANGFPIMQAHNPGLSPRLNRALQSDAKARGLVAKARAALGMPKLAAPKLPTNGGWNLSERDLKLLNRLVQGQVQKADAKTDKKAKKADKKKTKKAAAKKNEKAKKEKKAVPVAKKAATPAPAPAAAPAAAAQKPAVAAALMETSATTMVDAMLTDNLEAELYDLSPLDEEEVMEAAAEENDATFDTAMLESDSESDSDSEADPSAMPDVSAVHAAAEEESTNEAALLEAVAQQAVEAEQELDAAMESDAEAESESDAESDADAEADEPITAASDPKLIFSARRMKRAPRPEVDHGPAAATDATARVFTEQPNLSRVDIATKNGINVGFHNPQNQPHSWAYWQKAGPPM